MAQQLCEELRTTIEKEVEEKLRTTIRQEIEKEVEQELRTKIENESKTTTASSLSEAFWAVQKLKAVAHLSDNTKKLAVFKDIIPDLNVSFDPQASWVGLYMPKQLIPSLHGNLTWIVTFHRKDGSISEKETTSGKFNCGRFFVKTDQVVKSWGSSFKKENWESVALIIVEVLFERNSEEKIKTWKTIEEKSEKDE
jgi:hypothetical protein